MQATTIYRCALGLALALGASGCDPKPVEVSGTVRYNRAVLNKPDGQVVFVGPAGEQAAAPIGPDGTYQVRAMPGVNRVVAYYPNPKAKSERVPKPMPKPGVELPPLPLPVPSYLTPAKYASADTSELTVTLDKDTVFDIDLTGPPIK